MHAVRKHPTWACVAVTGAFSVAAASLTGAPARGAVTDRQQAANATVVSARAHTPERTPVVTPRVREVPVPDVDRPQAPRSSARSRPQPVHGYGVVGATWRGQTPPALRLSVRTRTDGDWSGWQPLDAGEFAVDLAGHGPDPASPEVHDVRAGSDPLAVGEVDAVQLSASSATGRAPRDLELSVIDPGRSPADVPGALAATADASAGAAVNAEPAALTTLTDDWGKNPWVRAPKPKLRPRRAWGADERLRSGSPDYGRVRAGFVHHTVNANRYSRRDVPAIIRGIYAYHTQSLGWSDIGYNFLVDRFGRKWIGRYGGPRRAVIGAHTYGYNHVATGMAAIGNFQNRRPSRRMVVAFGRMMGWKLGLHGVRAGDRTRRLEGRRFRAINGHRDAGQTACPGYKLYRRLPAIRRTAIRWQHH
jgi:N-acetylmuramoyl-L-alanine amidase